MVQRRKLVNSAELLKVGSETLRDCVKDNFTGGLID